MRRESLFIRMSNDKWYENPTIYDSTQCWFLCFDNKESEIVVKVDYDMSDDMKKEKIQKTLNNSGIFAKIIKCEYSGYRLFPPDWKELDRSIRAVLKIERNIDLKNLKIKHDGVYLDIPSKRDRIQMYDFNYG